MFGKNVRFFCMGVVFVMGDMVLFGMEQKKTVASLAELVEVAKPYACKHFNEGHTIYFDGNDGFNQCHINALMVASYAKPGQSFENLCDKQQMFLTYNLLTSIPCGFTGNTGPAAMQKFFDIQCEPRLLKSLRSSKSQVRQEMNDYILDAKREFFDQHNHIKWDNCGFYGEDVKRLNLPKFVGIEFFLNEIKRKQIPLVIKCNTLYAYERQVQTFLIMPDQKKSVFVAHDEVDACLVVHNLEKQSPVVVVEGNASPDGDSCIPHRQRFQAIDSDALQLAIAAKWTEKQQPMARNNMVHEQKEHYDFYLQHADELGLSWCGNKTFSIYHMFPDNLVDALSAQDMRTMERIRY